MSSFQTLTLEYRVSDRCDGTTVAPPFSEGVLDERQIYVFEVGRLGVIPLRFDEDPVNPPLPAAPATRILTWCLMTGVPTDNNFGSGMWIGLVERVAGLGTIAIEPVGQISAGSEGLYIKRCINVPQGCVLLVNDIEAPLGYAAIIRIRVQQLSNSEQQQQLDLACCCKRDLVDINVPDGTNTACPPNLNLISISPFGAMLNNIATTLVTLTGSGFSSLNNIAVAFSGSGPGPAPVQLPVSSIVVVDDSTVTVEVLPNSVGIFDVFIGDIDIENCFSMLTSAFQVTPA